MKRTSEASRAEQANIFGEIIISQKHAVFSNIQTAVLGMRIFTLFSHKYDLVGSKLDFFKNENDQKVGKVWSRLKLEHP